MVKKTYFVIPARKNSKRIKNGICFRYIDEIFLNNINNMIKDAKQDYDIVSVIDTLKLKMFN